jgi:hypothetical protein
MGVDGLHELLQLKWGKHTWLQDDRGEDGKLRRRTRFLSIV